MEPVAAFFHSCWAWSYENYERPPFTAPVVIYAVYPDGSCTYYGIGTYRAGGPDMLHPYGFSGEGPLLTGDTLPRDPNSEPMCYPELDWEEDGQDNWTRVCNLYRSEQSYNDGDEPFVVVRDLPPGVMGNEDPRLDCRSLFDAMSGCVVAPLRGKAEIPFFWTSLLGTSEVPL